MVGIILPKDGMETYICQRGDPWSAMDLDRALAEAARQVPEGHTATLRVDHWRKEDVALALMDGLSIVVDANADVIVQVFHESVDPYSRACELCGKTCGTPRAKGGNLPRLLPVRG
jgi:hypothetical protein